ncbi:uncharacterized protein LOC110112523 [Dendrobium catenatum]|uniref:uncharacterized protein LOC110112523 n=1 Tax=Dendrobium catenatum TaxID=906689 RepID=UPI0009F650CC|nr:uncharacterized protein LOC110112523 [Dendrobium catenatum]
MIIRSKAGIFKPKQILSLTCSADNNSTPLTYKQASKHPHWQIAMQEEINALHKQQTWSLVPVPPNKPILGCKWTYKTKMHPTGKLDRYKARLVALGYNQTYGENYTETFSPVAKMTTIRIVLILVVNRRRKMLQLDVSNAFPAR